MQFIDGANFAQPFGIENSENNQSPVDHSRVSKDDDEDCNFITMNGLYAKQNFKKIVKRL